MGCLSYSNFHYLISLRGSIRFAELIVGLIVMSMMSYYFDQVYYTAENHIITTYGHEKTGVFVLLVTSACVITTFLLLASSLVSESTQATLPTTVFETSYHLIAFLLHTIGGVVFLIQLNDRKSMPEYTGQMAASVMSLINAALYLCSTVLSFISFRAG